MTLVVGLVGGESIWLMADRRLSSRGKPVKDDARKLMFLETTDGVGVLGYAGLGATSLGTEPADWMSAVLRGRNHPLDHSLGVLAGAMRRQFPPHMRKGAPIHNVIIPAFENGKPTLFTIDLMLSPDGKQIGFRRARHISKFPRPIVMVGGSGAVSLVPHHLRWMRPLLRLLKRHEKGLLSAHAVADRLANLNFSVHRSDNSVGPRCIVAWRHRKEGRFKGGGAHLFYSGEARDASHASLPTISNGMDVAGLITAIWPETMGHLQAMLRGEEDQLNKAAMDARVREKVAKLPHAPDEILR